MAPNIIPRHSHIRFLIYSDPDPLITVKRFVLKHYGVGASSSVCGASLSLCNLGLIKVLTLTAALNLECRIIQTLMTNFIRFVLGLDLC